jgi:hypothetical protein
MMPMPRLLEIAFHGVRLGFDLAWPGDEGEGQVVGDAERTDGDGFHLGFIVRKGINKAWMARSSRAMTI